MVDALVAEFPDMKHDLLDETWSGLLHPQMGCFARYAQDAIDGGDRGTVRRCFELAEHFLREGNADVQNAVAVSFLEHLNFEDRERARAWARDLLPLLLRQELEEIEG